MSTTPFGGAALIVALLAAPGPSSPAEPPPPASGEVQSIAPQRTPGALTGACYLTFGERLECLEDASEGECRQRCDDLLCDSYTWRDRLPCWNWGYGS
jgi:hypothetical protein